MSIVPHRTSNVNSALLGAQSAPPEPESGDIVAWAREYIRRGWRVIPLQRYRGEGKQPKAERGWNLPEYYECVAQAPEQFIEPHDNVGLLVGSASGVVDVDLDAPESRELARWFLPSTPCKFGRRSAPESHWLYRPNRPMRKSVFVDPACDTDARATLLELRADSQNGRPHNTMLPPSIHTGSGEPVEWCTPCGLPADVDADELLRSVRHLAAASLLLRYWTHGRRHTLALGVSGLLLKAGWAEEAVERLVDLIAVAAGDEERDARLRDVRDTAAALQRGETVAGRSLLETSLGEDATRKLIEWFGVSVDNPRERPRLVSLEDAQAEGVVRGCLLALEQLWRGRYRWCVEWDVWLRWTGQVWARSDEDYVLRQAHEDLVTHFVDATRQAKDRKTQGIYAEYVATLAYSNRAALQALRLLRGSAGFHTHARELDSDPHYLNTPRGIVDLRSLELHPHEPERLMTRITRGAPYTGARAARFERFLHEIFAGDEELIAFVQRSCGLALVGENRHQLLYIWHGAGANGKSTLAQLLIYTLGDYARAIPRDALVGRERRVGGERRVALAALEGVRFGVLEEFEDGAELSPSALKNLVSNLRLSLRGLYEAYREIPIQLTPIACTNVKPNLCEHTTAVWRRLRLVPFRVVIPPEQRDPALLQQLQLEADGIIDWLLTGLRDYWARGARLDEPPQVLAATDEYRREIDPLATFLEEQCVTGTGVSVSARELYEAFVNWWRLHGDGEAMSQTKFGRELRLRGFLSARDNATRRKVWYGVGLRDLLPALEAQREGTVPETVRNGSGEFQNLSTDHDAFFLKSPETVSNCFELPADSSQDTDLADLLASRRDGHALVSWLWGWAESRDFPALAFDSGQRVLACKSAWRSFLRTAELDKLERARRAAEST